MATVSKVINERLRRRRRRPRAGHERSSRRSGYEASLVAHSLRNHRTNVIGILVADLEPFSAELLKGAADAIRGTGYELVVYSAGGRPDEHAGWERRYLSRLSGTLIDGAVRRHARPSSTSNLRLAGRRGRPAHRAVATCRPSTPTTSRGAELATEHLIELGHRRIGMLTGRPDLRIGPPARGRLPERHGRGRRAQSTRSLCRSATTTPSAPPAPAHELLTGAGPPDRVVRRERHLGDRGHRRRSRTRARRARRPVGHRLRQHPRIRAHEPATDHRRAADPADGPPRRSG